jgi:hypothetical protein
MDSATELDTDELFFQQGEEGTYFGGPTRPPSLAPVELELDAAPLDSDQLARAGRFRKPVALLVSSLGVMFLLALAMRRPAAESYAAAADAPGLSAAVVTPPVASLEAPPLAEPFIAPPLAPLPAPSPSVAATEPATAEPGVAEPAAAEPAAAEPAAAEPMPAAQRPSPNNRPPTSRASTLKPRPSTPIAVTPIALTPSAMTLKSRITGQPSAAQQTPRVVPAARFPDYKP